MLPGLSDLELMRLRMSVGYGTHKKGRLLSPIEIGLLLRKACDAGASLRDCSNAIRLDASNCGRFLRILNLPHDIQHLVDWGGPKDGIGFSAAIELVRLQDADLQLELANFIPANGLNSKEVQQVVQLRIRSGRAIDECVKEVLGMRPTIEKRYVFIGSFVDQGIENALIELTQTERNSILASGIERLGLRGATGRLGKRFFTLVGDERFNASMKRVGKDRIEAQFRTYIAEVVENAQASC